MGAFEKIEVQVLGHWYKSKCCQFY